MSVTETDTGERQGTPFIFRGEVLALDLVNTEIIARGKQRDLLATPQDVQRWWQEACHHHPHRDQVRTEGGEDLIVYDNALLQALKALRRALRAIFSAIVHGIEPAVENICLLNDILRTGYIALERTEEGELSAIYQTTDTRKGALLFPIALSALHLLQEGERNRLHECANERCIIFFYDTTRSATRRWCSLGCMDRARSLQRYRQARQAKEGLVSSGK